MIWLFRRPNNDKILVTKHKNKTAEIIRVVGETKKPDQDKFI
jgi:hypothetical protein